MIREEIAERLPDVFRPVPDDDDPLWALLGVMETLHEHPEEVLEDFGRYLEPRTAPDEFVPLLSWWLDLGWLFVDPPDDPYAQVRRPFSGGLGALRELAASAARESKWRGTRRGLLRRLETATGITGFGVDENVAGPDGRPIPFSIRVIAPEGAGGMRELVQLITEHEKPAHVTPLYAGAGFDAAAPPEPAAAPTEAAPPPPPPAPAAEEPDDPFDPPTLIHEIVKRAPPADQTT